MRIEFTMITLTILMGLALGQCVSPNAEDDTLQSLNETRMRYAQCKDQLYACRNKQSIEEEETSDE